MDWRVKNFESKATTAFTFLLDQGFAAAAESSGDMRRRPTTLRVRFMSADMTVETALSLALAGEDTIHTKVLTTDGSREFGPSVAHKGHEMQKALQTQATEVRDFLDLN
jgi:hypothetical protein